MDNMFDGFFDELAKQMNPWSEWAGTIETAYKALADTDLPESVVDDITVVVAENTLGIMRDAIKGEG